MAVKQLKVVGDFETTTDPDDVRVWAACAVEIETGKTVFLGNTIDDFFDWLANKNTVCYFHNLRFDAEFILSHILRLGYEYSETPKEGCFKTLISDMGVFYSVTVWFQQRNKNWKKVVFYDSFKKLPMPVSEIAKTFDLPMRKLHIDYKAYREPGHELTPEESEYVQIDCKIVAAALKQQLEQGLKKMTASSDAMAEYKDRLGRKTFMYYFPSFPVELDIALRKAYKGGVTMCMPKYANVRGLMGISFDINSMYPAMMYNKVLPHGIPFSFKGEPVYDKRFPLYIMEVEVMFEIKPDHIPCIQLKSHLYADPEYVTTSNGEMITLYVTNVDWELINEQYEILDVIYHKGWYFKGATGFFKEYIDHWMAVKERSTGGERYLAKGMLNKLYGKYGTNPEDKLKVPYLDPDEVVRYYDPDKEEVVDGVKVKLKNPVTRYRDPVYVPMATFITSYARANLIRSGQKVYDRLIYMDTDSMYLEGFEMPEGLDIHETRLGAWKHEATFTDSLFIRSKTYMITDRCTKKKNLRNLAKIMSISEHFWIDGDVITYDIVRIKCAGMPSDVKKGITYDDFHPGATFFGKLVPRRYRGGVVLTETGFTIKG